MIKRICEKYGRNYSKELENRMHGETDREVCLTVVRELKMPISADEFELQVSVLAEKMLPAAPLKKGAERLLRHLHDYKVPVALATNSTEQAVRLHATARPLLFGLFHHKVSVTDPEVNRPKPNPDIYLVAASRFPDKPKPYQCDTYVQQLAQAEDEESSLKFLDLMAIVELILGAIHELRHTFLGSKFAMGLELIPLIVGGILYFCLVFEDSAIGVEAAKEAGMQVVMIPDPKLDRELTRQATLVIRSLMDFKPELFGLPPFDEAASKAKSKNVPSKEA